MERVEVAGAVLGGVAGAVVGGPAGAVAGAQAGRSAGKAAKWAAEKVSGLASKVRGWCTEGARHEARRQQARKRKPRIVKATAEHVEPAKVQFALAVSESHPSALDPETFYMGRPELERVMRGPWASAAAARLGAELKTYVVESVKLGEWL